MKDLNKDLLTLVENKERFANVAPMLFKDGFEKIMNEHVYQQVIKQQRNDWVVSFSEGPPPGQYYGNAGAAIVIEDTGDTSLTTGATMGEKKISRGRNLRTTKPIENQDYQSRDNNRRTLCKSLVCICKHSSSINHEPTFLPEDDCQDQA